MVDPEMIWSSLLSRDADRIREIWNLLDAEEQAAVQAHLNRMATESGWTEPQRVSAQMALDALSDRRDSDGDSNQ